MQHIQCVVELRSGERVSGELVLRPDGSAIVKCGEAAIEPRFVETVRVPGDCPVEALDAAVMSGYYVLGAAKSLQ